MLVQIYPCGTLWYQASNKVPQKTEQISLFLSPSLCPLVSPLQSIDPGQQFTWENSNLEVNKPKNRYANVIAYDHSRVVLTPVDGKSQTNVLTFNISLWWQMCVFRESN